MRVVSLVPSLTETLLDCGVEVVGRTRFCIHPYDIVSSIPSVGGTKQVNWETCSALAPDLVVMDREENTLTMAETCPFPWHATHIRSIEDVGPALAELADVTANQALRELAGKWIVLADMPSAGFNGWKSLPGVQTVIGNPAGTTKLEYMIWRDPWMAASARTFIGSMLSKVGVGDRLVPHDKPYPTLAANALPRDDTCYLFSSEPFPFDRYTEELARLGFNGALVDGEFYSWFGSRSYRLLDAFLNRQAP